MRNEVAVYMLIVSAVHKGLCFWENRLVTCDKFGCGC